MNYKYTGTLVVSDLEDNSMETPFSFTHNEQLIFHFVKHYAILEVFTESFTSNPKTRNMCRIGSLGYKMEEIVCAN